MPLRPETVDRVVAMWARWPPVDNGTLVTVTEIGDQLFVFAPAELLDCVAATAFDADDVIERLGEHAVRLVGVARLAYGDDRTLRLSAADGVIDIADDDPRLAALEAVSERAEWLEASADEPGRARVGVVEHDELVALSTLQVWDETVGHFGVFTRADARGRGLARTTSSEVIRRSLAGDLVPQWRSRVDNYASAAVADRLGFVPLGQQIFVRVRPAAT